jgi:hypothetical protein
MDSSPTHPQSTHQLLLMLPAAAAVPTGAGAAAVCVDKQDGCATCLNGQRCSKCYPVGYGLVQGVCKKVGGMRGWARLPN